MINSTNPREITISKFAVNEADQKRVVSPRVDDVIRAVAELGGTYPDVVQMLQEAKASGALASRFEIDAVPEAGRTYERTASGGGNGDIEQSNNSAKAGSGNPAPDLFYKKVGSSTADDGDDAAKSSKNDSDQADSEEKPKPKLGFFGKMFGFASKE